MSVRACHYSRTRAGEPSFRIPGHGEGYGKFDPIEVVPCGHRAVAKVGPVQTPVCVAHAELRGYQVTTRAQVSL